MALTPSLSLWSSIKIPFILCGRKKSTPSVSFVDSCKGLKQRNHKKEAKTAQKTVNLRVPDYLGKIENSTPNLFFCTLSGKDKKKTRRRCSDHLKTKRINQVIIPNGDKFNKQEDWEEIIADNHEENVFSSEKLFAAMAEDLNDFGFKGFCEKGDCDNIPSVKPWTQKELDEINRKHNSLENEILQMCGDRKKKIKRRANILTRCDRERSIKYS